MKRKNISILFLLILFALVSAAQANLTWSPTNEITLNVGEIKTIQIYSDNPGLRSYGVIMGADWETSDAAQITDVTPLELAGDLAFAGVLESPGWWYLHSGWSDVGPISVWGDHWDVSIEGLSVGTYSLNSDIYMIAGTENDVLSITVVPEPTTIGLLGLGAALLIRKKR
ncbi:MAG: PEP-CTERM sorting domain-containing protein [Sedimentisphaerales bacterium]